MPSAFRGNRKSGRLKGTCIVWGRTNYRDLEADAMDLAEVLMNCLAGLGLLFVGIKMVTRNLAAVVGDRIRKAISWASARTGVAMVIGAIAGFVAQSGRTTSFVIASFVHAGIVDVRRALPIVLWSNFGCSLVIFAAVFPLHLLALFLLAAAGVCVAFERPRPLLNAASATFGLALMLFGLKMTSTTATLLPGIDGFSTALDLIAGSLWLSFLTGLVLTLIAQSHMSIMLIAVSFAAKGVFGLDQTLMLICGAQAGSSAITYLTGVHFRGVPRQVVVGQIVYSLAGIVLVFAAYAAFRGIWGPLAQQIPASSIGAGQQAALMVIGFNLVTPLALTLGMPAYQRLCAHLSPPRDDEELGRPEFLHGEVGDNAAVTLMLAEREQLRLLRRLPHYCELLRGDVAQEAAAVERYSDAFIQVGQCIERAQSSLMAMSMSSENTEWLINQQKRQHMLCALHDACHELYRSSRDAGTEILPLRSTVVETLDTLLLTLIEGMTSQDRDELELVERMTAGQGAAMERVRKKYLSLADSMAEADRIRILQLTSVFEHAAWSLRNFAQLLSAIVNGTVNNETYLESETRIMRAVA